MSFENRIECFDLIGVFHVKLSIKLEVLGHPTNAGSWFVSSVLCHNAG